MSTEAQLFITAHQRRAYGTAILDNLLLSCARQQAPVYQSHIVPLLQAAKEFRNIADPGPFFAEVRNTEVSLDYLKQRMAAITAVLADAEQHSHQSKVLAAALVYCTASIMDRLNDLSPDDKILQLYNQEAV